MCPDAVPSFSWSVRMIDHLAQLYLLNSAFQSSLTSILAAFQYVCDCWVRSQASLSSQRRRDPQNELKIPLLIHSSKFQSLNPVLWRGTYELWVHARIYCAPSQGCSLSHSLGSWLLRFESWIPHQLSPWLSLSSVPRRCSMSLQYTQMILWVIGLWIACPGHLCIHIFLRKRHNLIARWFSIGWKLVHQGITSQRDVSIAFSDSLALDQLQSMRLSSCFHWIDRREELRECSWCQIGVRYIWCQRDLQAWQFSCQVFLKRPFQLVKLALWRCSHEQTTPFYHSSTSLSTF